MNLLNRSLAEGIRRVGFRKWYERELLSSHAHMLLAFLCVIALMASMEAFHGASTGGKIADVFFIIASAVPTRGIRLGLSLVLSLRRAFPGFP